MARKSKGSVVSESVEIVPVVETTVPTVEQLQEEAVATMLGAEDADVDLDLAEEAEPAESKKRKRPRLMVDENGRPLHGLTATPDGFALGGPKLVRQQFANIAAWYTHMAYVQGLYQAEYTAMAADALANPAKYAKATGKETMRAELASAQAKVDKLAAVLTDAMRQAGRSEEEIQAALASL